MSVNAKKAIFVMSAVIFVAAVIFGAIIFSGRSYDQQTDKRAGVISTPPPEEAVVQAEKKTTFVIAGDVMFDRLVYHNFKYKGLDGIFEKFGKDVFRGANLAMVNLEGPISDAAITDDVSPDNLVFNFPPATTLALNYAGISAVSLANNHTSNAGVSGFERTKRILDQNSIKYAGSPSSINNDSVLKIDGDIPLSIIAVNVLSAGGDLTDLIAGEKALGRFVIIFPHWGNEYQDKHSGAQEKLAHTWIDEGTDMIVGSHPHVVQDFEIYQGSPIVYSLGNFVFDQTFSKETQQGLVLAGVIREKSLELTFLLTQQIHLMPELLAGSDKARLVEKILSGVSGFEKVSDDTIKINL
jgi:poly-gamma-glutamate synthesis protein (capsule biosynthesis protein)